MKRKLRRHIRNRKYSRNHDLEHLCNTRGIICTVSTGMGPYQLWDFAWVAAETTFDSIPKLGDILPPRLETLNIHMVAVPGVYEPSETSGWMLEELADRTVAELVYETREFDVAMRLLREFFEVGRDDIL